MKASWLFSKHPLLIDQELATDIVGLEIKGDDQAHKFLGVWRDQDMKNEHLYQFIRENKIATYGMKVGA